MTMTKKKKYNYYRLIACAILLGLFIFNFFNWFLDVTNGVLISTYFFFERMWLEYATVLAEDFKKREYIQLSIFAPFLKDFFTVELGETFYILKDGKSNGLNFFLYRDQLSLLNFNAFLENNTNHFFRLFFCDIGNFGNSEFFHFSPSYQRVEPLSQADKFENLIFSNNRKFFVPMSSFTGFGSIAILFDFDYLSQFFIDPFYITNYNFPFDLYFKKYFYQIYGLSPYIYDIFLIEYTQQKLISEFNSPVSEGGGGADSLLKFIQFFSKNEINFFLVDKYFLLNLVDSDDFIPSFIKEGMKSSDPGLKNNFNPFLYPFFNFYSTFYYNQLNSFHAWSIFSFISFLLLASFIKG